MDKNLQTADLIEVPDEDFAGIATEDTEEPKAEETTTEEIDTETPDTEESTEEAEKGKPEQKPAEQKSERTVPLSALTAERKKLLERIKELEAKAKVADRMAEATGKSHDQIIAEIDTWKTQNLVEKEGLPEAYARKLVELERNNEETRRLLKEQKYSAEIEKLKTQFPGLETHRDEVIEYADKHGMTAKQAYFALHGDDIYADMQTLAEQRALANQQKKAGAKIDISPTGQQTQAKITLSKEEMRFAQEAGISPAEYQRMKYSTNYESFKKNFPKKG